MKRRIIKKILFGLLLIITCFVGFVGGDFNHDLITNNPNHDYNNNKRPFNNVLKNPDWITTYFDENGNLGIDGFAYSDHQPAYIEFKLK